MNLHLSGYKKCIFKGSPQGSRNENPARCINVCLMGFATSYWEYGIPFNQAVFPELCDVSAQGCDTFADSGKINVIL